MNLESLSARLTRSLTKEGNYTSEQKEIIAYGLETIMLSLSGFSLILAIGMLTQAWLPALIAAIFGGTLRRLSGGAHFSTPGKCLVFGAVIYSGIGILAQMLAASWLIADEALVVVLISMLIISLGINAVFAPVDSEAKPIHSPDLKRKLKFASLGFILISLGILIFSKISLLAVSATLGIFYQSMTLLPIFNQRRWRA